MHKKVAILTMSLNIGGAETHIYELANALKRHGNDVTVFSSGGVYAKKLAENGITHVTAPLNKKDPVSLWRGYRAVAKYVKQNRTCVIHSHTRISNFTARLINKRYRRPFVSTVHFNFKTSLLFKMFTRWGDRALAVSEDLKDYAVREYGYEKDKITVTVNGINLDTFRKNRLPDFREKMGFTPENRVILCVSRLDEVAGDHVERMLNLAKRIYADTPESRIVIVGGGTRYDEFCKKAEKINAETCDGFIRLTGPQTDIYRYCNIADLFVGISRAALEAMACETPVILLGNSGYIGLFSDKTEKLCVDTNFTCRGCPYPPDAEIAALIKDMLAKPQKYAENVRAGLEIVKSRYSVDKMASDAEAAYSAAEKDLRPVDFMLCGYYGRNNLGDDIALKAFSDNINAACGGANMVLLSADTKNSGGADFSRVLHRFNLPAIYRAMKKTNVFMLGSGSILQDATSSRSVFYYTHIAKKAIGYGCKLMLYSNGVGPINREKNRVRTQKLLNRADVITVRDRRSAVYMNSIGVKNPNVTLTADETFTLNGADIREHCDMLNDGRYLCVNLREAGTDDKFIERFAGFIDKAAEKHGYTTVLLPLHYDKDADVLKKLAERLKSEHILIDRELPHAQVLDVISRCDTAVMERLHAVTFSCIYCKPFLALNYDPKVMSLCIEMGMEDYIIDFADVSDAETGAKFDGLIADRENIENMLKERVAKKRELAQINSKLAFELLREM